MIATSGLRAAIGSAALSTSGRLQKLTCRARVLRDVGRHVHVVRRDPSRSCRRKVRAARGRRLIARFLTRESPPVPCRGPAGRPRGILRPICPSRCAVARWSASHGSAAQREGQLHQRGHGDDEHRQRQDERLLAAHEHEQRDHQAATAPRGGRRATSRRDRRCGWWRTKPASHSSGASVRATAAPSSSAPASNAAALPVGS